LANLIHEIWEVIDDRGQVLPSLVLAGPDGDAARKLLREEAGEDNQAAPRCVLRFEAESHDEAMQLYYRHYGRGQYVSEFVCDREPYPEEWAQWQRQNKLRTL
jgi:hypothetical protein